VKLVLSSLGNPSDAVVVVARGDFLILGKVLLETYRTIGIQDGEMRAWLFT
jgi:hypothetical protein